MDNLSSQFASFLASFGSPGTATTPHQSNPYSCSFENVPPEVLSWILYLALFGNATILKHGPPDFKRYQTLASVCRTWRTAVLGTPYLWARIISTDMLERRLALSRSTPLDIDVRFPNYGEEFRAIPKLVSERHRWKRLSVTGPDIVLSTFVQNLTWSPPILEHLQLEGLSYRTIVDLACLREPHLESLHDSAQSETPSIVLTNLRFLCLSSVYIIDGDVETLLAQCPALTTLRLDNVGCSDASESEEARTRPNVLLPSLEALEIKEPERQFFISVLDSLTAPVLCSFHFDGGVYISESPPFPYEILYDNKAVPALISQILGNLPTSLVKVYARLNLLHISVNDILSFLVGYPRKETSSLLKNVITIFRLDSRPACLEVVWSDAETTTWRGILEAMQLVSLHVVINHLHELDDVCNLLAHWPLGCSHPTSLRILVDDSGTGKTISKRDMEPVVRGMLQQAKQEIVVELGEGEVFNAPTGKFHKRPEQRSAETGAANKGKWRFAF